MQFETIQELVQYAEKKYNTPFTKSKANLYVADINISELGLFSNILEQAYLTVNFSKREWNIGFKWKVKERNGYDSKILESYIELPIFEEDEEGNYVSKGSKYRYEETKLI